MTQEEIAAKIADMVAVAEDQIEESDRDRQLILEFLMSDLEKLVEEIRS